jgi:integrase/recombinase XerD
MGEQPEPPLSGRVTRKPSKSYKKECQDKNLPFGSMPIDFLSRHSAELRLAALRFFYIKTLKKTWSSAGTPYPKRAFHLPSILSREEVAQLIDAALTPFHRTLLMTLYATGVRRAELTHLKVADIDSKRMVIRI